MSEVAVHKLTDLQAEFQNAVDSVGRRHLTLQFVCPNCDNGHWHQVPLHSGAMGRRGDWLVWQYVSGKTVADISLAPSYLCACLHAFIRNGQLLALPDKKAPVEKVEIVSEQPVVDDEEREMAARMSEQAGDGGVNGQAVT